MILEQKFIPYQCNKQQKLPEIQESVIFNDFKFLTDDDYVSILFEIYYCFAKACSGLTARV